MEVTSKVVQQFKGLSLLEYLSKRFTYLSQSEWASRIAEGRLSVNGQSVSEEYVVLQGDSVTYDMPDFVEPIADLNYKIVFECDDFLAVDKPGNLLVHKHGRSVTHNLIYQLREVHNPLYPTADVVNRLDRHTSGLVLISKSKKVLAELQKLFVDRIVEKVYQAVVEGIVTDDYGHFNTPIGPLKDSTVKQKQGAVSHKLKEAVTEYKVLARSETRTLLELRPKTGRTHQLRVHCALAGYPLVGDALYSMSDDDFIKWRNGDKSLYTSDFPRQALHCCALQFHYRKQAYHIKAPAPLEFRELLK